MANATPTPTEPATRGLGGLFKHSAIYSAAPVLRQLISVGMHRLYTGWLGTAGVGIKENVDLWLIALQQLLGQNVLQAMVRFYFDREEPEERGRVVTSCILLLTGIAWAVCGTAFVFSGDLTPLMLHEGGEIPATELVDIVRLTFLLIPFQLATLSGFFYLQILKRSHAYTVIQMTKLLLEVGLNFYLMGHKDLGVRGFLTSMLIGEALTALSFSVWILWTLKPRVSPRVLKPILIYAAPLVPVGFCQLALHMADRRILLELDQGQQLAGIYGHGYKISYLTTTMMLGPFLQIWQPFIFDVEDARERAHLVARVSTYAVLSIVAVSLGVILFGRQGAILLSKPEYPEFWEAYRVIPWVAAGYVFWALYQVSQIPLYIAKRTLRLFFINLIPVAFNIGVNLWAIPRYGITGAAVTTCLTFALLSALGMLASRSEAHVPFELGRILGMLGCIVVAGAVALGVDGIEADSRLGIPMALLIKSLVLLALVGVLWWLVLVRDERQRFVTWVRRRAQRTPT